MKYSLRLLAFAISLLFGSEALLAQCPLPNACTPGNASNAQAGLFGAGIFEVRIGDTFTHTSAGTAEGYVDKCSLGTTPLTLGAPVSIYIRTGNNFSENVRVFVDANGDQVFTSPGELVFSSNNAKVHTGFFTISSGITDSTLKIRITSDLTTAAIPTACSTPVYGQVEDYAVKLLANTTPPVARFSVADSVSCTGLFSFTDQSVNNPTSWLWKFGDGQTSVQQNPTHQYSSPGFYTVTLKVTSANGADSLTRVNFLHYNDSVAAPAVCQPQTINQCCGYGISRVRLHTLDHSSSLGSFQDFACTQRVTLVQGRSYPILVGTNPNQDQDTRVWIDYNRNGIFEDGERIFEKLADRNPTGQVLISGDTSVKTGVPLRMRVMSEFAGGPFGPCSQLDKGQCEDYTVYILPNNFPPVAGFDVSGNSCSSSFSFQSTSLNVILFYHWYFGDGQDTLTLEPNVSHTYDSTGTYDVKLVVVGPNGVDSLSREGAVNYYGAPPSSCSLNSQAGGPPTGAGIRQVQFGSINRTSGSATEGYQNFSCTSQTLVFLGEKVNLTVRNTGTVPQKCRAWIDWNGNGQFETAEQVLNTQNDTVHTALVTVPATAKLESTLRMRIASNSQNSQSFGTCGTIQGGQAEDYGIVALRNTVPPVADFAAGTPVSCTGIVAFSDSSDNLPQTYLWNFGDNQTSSEPNPVHTYAATGSYTVTLIVTNEYGSDTLVKPSYITVSGTTGMEPAGCIPAAANTCCQYGISRVTFAGINQTSGLATEGYRDFTCGVLGSAPIGSAQSITVLNSGTNSENVAVWIDWNNDAVFADAERVFTSTNAISHTGTITVPSNAPAGLGLRVRVKSDAASQPIGTACGNPQLGQVEDYQIVLTGNNLAPQTFFSASATTLCSNTVSFSDTSFNAPTSWKWYFGDGDSSSLRNPEHTYPGPGTYSVTLIAANATGSDTLLKINYITILPGQNLKPAPCTPQTANVPNQPVGIGSVTLNTINRTSALSPDETYVDASCTNRTDLIQGQPYTITVQTNPSFPESVRAWVDWNNNGTFEDPAERVLSATNGTTHTAVVNVPVNAVLDTALRLRVMSDVGGGPGGVNLQPCNSLGFGQCEDYAVIVRQNTTPPDAVLSASATETCSGYVRFLDKSLFVPTSWLWSFGDGQTSTQQNPVHAYTQTGQYTVKLKVNNTFGSDSVEIPNYVTVTGINGMNVASCINTVTTPNPNLGTTRVRIGTLDKTSGFSAEDGGYLDYTCSDSALVVVTAPGQTNPLTVNTSQGNFRENCRVYIDYNNDGIFAVSESVLNSNNNNVHNANPVFTAGQCLGVPVRMRVLTDVRFNQIGSACFNPQQGQVEDYAIRLVWAVGNAPSVSASEPEVFPNPGTGLFTVRPAAGSSPRNWFVRDLTGRKVAEGPVTASPSGFRIDLRHLSPGVYYFRTDGDEKSSGLRLIVQP